LDNIRSHQVDCAPHSAIIEFLKQNLPPVPRNDLRTFFRTAAELSADLPDELTHPVRAFRDHSNGAGILHLTGLPVDDNALPSTPDVTPAPRGRRLLDMEACTALIATLLGSAAGYASNRSGEVFHDIYPVQDAPPLSTYVHKIPLAFHCDMGYLSKQPHFTVLGCSRADRDDSAATLVSSAPAISAALTEPDRNILRAVPLTWHLDSGFRSQTDPDPTTTVLVFGEDGAMRYDAKLIEPGVGQAASALQALAAAVIDLAIPIRLRQGDVLIIDNFRTAHARTAYRPRFDGKDRWLHRVYIRNPRLEPGQHTCHGDVIPDNLRRDGLRAVP
jgi:alpha-ketoglutarate-dependent taurine dioxygenase